MRHVMVALPANTMTHIVMTYIAEILAVALMLLLGVAILSI